MTRMFPPKPDAPRYKGIYIGAPAAYKLELACQHLWKAFCRSKDGWGGGIYVVGSCLQKPDWRDIDVRLILNDKSFEELFLCKAISHWEFHPRWLVMTTSISMWLQDQTGLPIDFQFQPQTHANERHKGKPRNAVGFILADGE